MKFTALNPLSWLNKALDSVAPAQAENQAQQEDQGAALPVPVGPVSVTPAQQEDQAGEQDQDTSVVRGRFVPARADDARSLAVYTVAAQRTDQFRKEAENFDDEKAPFGEKALRTCFSAFAYLVPSLLAVVIGMAVGDAFTPAGATTFYTWYAHTLSVALEASLPILGFAVSLTFRRAAKDRAQVAVCAICAVIFLLLGVGNAVVQIFMVTKNLGALNPSDQAAVYFRAFSPLIVDMVCTIYLAINGAKSLRRYIADRRAVIEAVRDISTINIELEQQQSAAAINQMQAAMDMDSKRKRAETWNRIDALYADSMVRNAERSMGGDEGDGYGSYRRRRY